MAEGTIIKLFENEDGSAVPSMPEFIETLTFQHERLYDTNKWPNFVLGLQEQEDNGLKTDAEICWCRYDSAWEEYRKRVKDERGLELHPSVKWCRLHGDSDYRRIGEISSTLRL